MQTISQHTAAAARFRSQADAAYLAGEHERYLELMELAENADEMADLEAEAERGE